MKPQYAFLPFFFIAIIFTVLQCRSNYSSGMNSLQSGNSIDTQKFMKLTGKNSSVNPLTPNLIDYQVMAHAVMLTEELYPIRTCQKMKLVERLDQLHRAQEPMLKKKLREFQTVLNKV